MTSNLIATTKRFLLRLGIAFSWVYLALLACWLLAYLTTGDRFGYLGFINLLAVYLFLPLPVVLLTAIAGRRRGLWIGFGLGLLVFIWLWGFQFSPARWKPVGQAQAQGPSLTVMTYNVLAWHEQTEPILDTIRTEGADVVFIQELNHRLARALGRELADSYPYQILQPVDNPSGIGVISKYPLFPVDQQLPHRWIGGPQLLTMDWNGHTVWLVNFHMLPTTRLASSQAIAHQFRQREEQARLLAGYARQHGPMILGGDANSGPLGEAYHIFTGELNDAWHQAGFGLGHTFPGSDIPGSSRPRIGDWAVPQWLSRIDYIFYSTHWEIISARLARVDGVSDHRGVVATLQLKP